MPLGLLGILLAGCGPRMERGEVEGTVRHQGRPLASVLVTFLPDPEQGGKGVRASGHTDDRGRYHLRGEDQRQGAAAGWHRVVVEDLALYSAPRESDGTLSRKPPVRFPARFGDPLQTPLRKQVRAGTQTIDIDLTP
jgi:hypothetical protein